MDAAVEGMDAIVRAGWDLSVGEPAIRACALATMAMLAILSAVAVELARGLPAAVLVVAALAAPALAAVLVIVAFRAFVLAWAGDGYGRRPDPIVVVGHAARCVPDVLITGARASRSRPRAPLASAIAVVNGVAADEAVRTARALGAHRWGLGAIVRGGSRLFALFLTPVVTFDVLAFLLWADLGPVRPLALLGAVLVTIVGTVVVVALDAAIRGALLRVARGDDTVLDPALVALMVKPGRERGRVTAPARRRQPRS